MILKILSPLPLLFIFICYAYAADFMDDKDTVNNNLNKPKRIYYTTRLTTERPVIDGVLDDNCWKTGEWAGNFTQWIPKEGSSPMAAPKSML